MDNCFYLLAGVSVERVMPDEEIVLRFAALDPGNLSLAASLSRVPVSGSLVIASRRFLCEVLQPQKSRRKQPIRPYPIGGRGLVGAGLRFVGGDGNYCPAGIFSEFQECETGQYGID